MLRFVRFRHGTNRTHTFLVSVLFREKKKYIKKTQEINRGLYIITFDCF